MSWGASRRPAGHPVMFFIGLRDSANQRRKFSAATRISTLPVYFAEI
jgi:hypothetical protein